MKLHGKIGSFKEEVGYLIMEVRGGGEYEAISYTKILKYESNF